MQRGHWRSIALVSLAITLAPAATATAAARNGFRTPEAAVEHFLKSLAANDLDGAMQAFAVAEYGAHIDFAAQARLNKTFVPTEGYGPSKYPAHRRINQINVVAELADETRSFIYGLLIDDARDEQLVEASDANIDGFIRSADPAALRALNIVRIDRPAPSLMKTKSALESAKKLAAFAGADDSTERIALLRLNGKHYVGGFRLLRYGGEWKIIHLHSSYAGGSPLGRPLRKITAEEYEGLTK